MTIRFQDYNYIDRLGPRAFSALSPRRLFLGFNRISNVDAAAFAGLEPNLELLDLEGNRVSSSANSTAEALSGLKSLRYLYLPSNNLTQLPETIFSGGVCPSLRALSVAGNGIRDFPR